jgi:DNA-binding transcriptional LysR family regulator
VNKLDSMRVFVRTAELGSFSAVAREMELSQATVSKKIAALESHLGVRLISRTSRTQSLTEAGAEYHQRCCAILAELEEADAIARGAHTSPSGTLRVSAPVVSTPPRTALDEFSRRVPTLEARPDSQRRVH